MPTPDGTLRQDVSRRVRGLARGLVTLAEGGDVEAALTLAEQLRDLLRQNLPAAEVRDRFERVLEGE